MNIQQKWRLIVHSNVQYHTFLFLLYIHITGRSKCWIVLSLYDWVQYNMALKTKSRHDAKFVITSGATSDDKVGIITTLDFQWICMLHKNHNIHFNGLVQDCSNSIANTLELLQSCTKPLNFDYELTKDIVTPDVRLSLEGLGGLLGVFLKKVSLLWLNSTVIENHP